ncbi:cobalt-precorrin 5A hydrolase [Lactonifactor longoviformis]|uniref:cobalt-precorrin 5A hydrolase n=1 Tax=Lactonifactor longoviformis TaxID=341220 RepID=UPI0036F3763A
MKIAVISFSRSGYALGEALHAGLIKEGHEVTTYTKSKYTKMVLDESQLDIDAKTIRNVKQFAKPVDESIGAWTSLRFQNSDALIFIGACGIAVRAIAPYVKDKKKDPAVVVVDEQGNYAISLLSGHIGGANALTLDVSRITGAKPVITTATDINEKFAVDVFAKRNGFYISDMGLAKDVSAALVAGKEVGFYSDFPWIGELPEGLKIAHEDEERPELGIAITSSYLEHPFVHTLYLVPRVITLGLGCRKDTVKEEIQNAVRKACDEQLIPTVAMEQVVSIDLKKDEPGILEYCRERNLPFITYTKEELAQVEGKFTKSEFVESITGLDNVCERSAVKGSEDGRLIVRKHAENGVTVALAMKKWSVEFE